MPKITLHMVASLDGLIAKKDNSVSWFDTTDHFEKGVQLTDEQTQSFLQTIDCYVMGAHTYAHALELSKSYGWAYGDTPTVVLSNRELPIERNTVQRYSGDLRKLVTEQLLPKYKHIWVAGGAMLAREFIRHQLAHEIRLSILPIVLGEGIPLFDQHLSEQQLHLVDVTAYRSGMVELQYSFKNFGN